MLSHERHMSSLKNLFSVITISTMLVTQTAVKPALAQERPNDIFVTSTASVPSEETAQSATTSLEVPPPQKADLKAKEQNKSSAIKTMHVSAITSYTSAVEECDDTPFVAADGTRTYDGMVATNMLPFGTKIRIPEYFGSKIFTVHDRMNTRYSNRVDVWTERKADALKFGIKRNALIEIVEMGNGKTSWNKKVAIK